MITTLHINGMILWDYVRRACSHEVFIAWGDDYAPYCPVKFEVL